MMRTWNVSNINRIAPRETEVRPISLLTLHPTKIARLKHSGKSPMGLGMSPL